MISGFKARGDPRRGVCNSISFGILDQSENRDCVVASRFQALSDEGSAGVGAFAGHFGEFGKPFAEQSSSWVRRRSARSASFGTGIWLLGFILPLIWGVNPPLILTCKVGITPTPAVILIPDSLLKVAPHAPGIDRAVFVPAEHAVAFQLEQ